MRIANKFISEIFLVTLAVNIRANKRRLGPVSYTHLTLPTIYSV